MNTINIVMRNSISCYTYMYPERFNRLVGLVIF